MGLFIIKIGVEWGWRAVTELSDEGLDAVTLAQVKKVIVETEGVRRMHQLRTRKMAERVMVDVHVQIDAYISAAEGHYISDCVRFHLMSDMPSIKDVTVHVDVDDDDDHPHVMPTAKPPTRSAILAACLSAWEKVVAKDQIIHRTLTRGNDAEGFEQQINKALARLDIATDAFLASGE